jgi:hypothetical protein
MQIPVIYADSSSGIVSPDQLDRLIEQRRIQAFRRREGMVRVGRDPVRGRGGSYRGQERRQQSGQGSP